MSLKRMERLRPWRSDAGGTSPWTGEGRIMQQQLSRATQELVAEEQYIDLAYSALNSR
ncbi:protein of unknown function [Shewanella benthica]|uniref:Uncharacterized protein n=1 Tax=Shewanella benthica TaxID=43661 RepID=A0A330M2S1_9GAMM|nr:protein of unknown function [Shewanella benthica]